MSPESRAWAEQGALPRGSVPSGPSGPESQVPTAAVPGGFPVCPAARASWPGAEAPSGEGARSLEPRGACWLQLKRLCWGASSPRERPPPPQEGAPCRSSLRTPPCAFPGTSWLSLRESPAARSPTWPGSAPPTTTRSSSPGASEPPRTCTLFRPRALLLLTRGLRWGHGGDVSSCWGQACR